jgi:hypothetical protein
MSPGRLSNHCHVQELLQAAAKVLSPHDSAVYASVKMHKLELADGARPTYADLVQAFVVANATPRPARNDLLVRALWREIEHDVQLDDFSLPEAHWTAMNVGDRFTVHCLRKLVKRNGVHISEWERPW